MKVYLGAVVAVMQCCGATLAQSNVDLDSLDSKVWALMQCSVYAQMAAGSADVMAKLASPTAAGRLFSLSISYGTTFATAYRNGLIKRPSGLSASLGTAPSVDFALGEYFERASEAAWNDANAVTSTVSPGKQLEAIQNYGQGMFDKGNCGFLQ